MDDALERYPGLRFGLQELLSTTTPEEYARRSEIVEYMMEEAMRASKGKPRDDADKREEEDESESEPVDEPEHSALHVTDPRKGESTSEQTMDVEVEDPGGFVAPPPSRRRNGTGSVVCRTSTSGRKRWRAMIQQNYEGKMLGWYDTKEEAENACDGYLENPGGFVAPPRLKRRSGTGSAVYRKYTSGRERWEAVIQQNKERKVLGVYDTKVEAENACDSYLEDPDGFVRPPLLIRRRGTGSVKPSKYGRFTATYKGKHIGTFDTGTQAYSAIDAIIAQGGTSKTNPVTSSTSGLEELAMMALEQPESSKRPRSDDEEDVEKFTDFEIGHLVFARSGKSNWAPAQISAISYISTSDKISGWPGARMHRVYDVEFFVKENGVYPRAQNLPISKLEAADEDTFEKHSGRRKSKNWVEGMKKFRRLYDKSRRV